MSQLLQQVRLIDPVSETDRVADVLIADGYIKAICANVSEIGNETEIIDGRGLILGTGLIDLYSHCGEPGFEERETLSSLLQAASAGGFTRISILPDTSPAIDNPATVALLHHGAQNSLTVGSGALPKLQIWGALTHNLQGEKMTEFADLAAAGVVGFADGYPLSNLGLVRRLLEYLQHAGKPVAFWCCDRQLVGNGVMREGTDSIRLGLPGNPAAAETTAIASLLELVAATHTPVHIMRVSCARSVELIAKAKSQNLPVTASTTWMHLLLDTKKIERYNESLKIEPPLGNSADMAALRQGVVEGIIEAIAIDHTPYTYEEKTVAFALSPPGAIGLELALPLLWENLVETGEFTALELWRSLSQHPASCLFQSPSRIVVGAQAELTLFDPQKTWLVESQNLYSLSSNTPWLGKQVRGKVVQTWCT